MVYVYDQDTDRWLQKGRDALLGTAGTQVPIALGTFSASNLACSFDGSASYQPGGLVTAYAWNFGDGTTGSGITPSHTYAAPGTYAVTLVVTGSSGKSSTWSGSITVTASQAPKPTASFTYTQGTGTDSYRLNVDASNSTVPLGKIVAYDWDFGNGVKFHSTSPKANGFYYTAAGNYTVGLTVTTDAGATASTTQAVKVSAPANSNTSPTARIATPVVNGLTVAFDGTTSSDPDTGDSIRSYAWDFGDGTTSTAAKPSHTYASAGTRTVSLTVTDSGGLTGQTSATVSTSAPSSGGVEPTGPNIVSVDSLPGSDLSAKIDATPAGKQTSMGPKVYEFEGFRKQYSTVSAGFGVQISKATALLGSGIDKTIIRMSAASAANTGKKAPTSGTTFLEYVWTGTTFKLLQDLTIQGMPINDGDWGPDGGYQPPSASYPKTLNQYNGLYLAKFNNGVVRRVKVTHIPGSIYYPPGETFGMDVYSTDTALFEDIILDGENVGASGFGPNSSGNLTVRRLEAMGWKYGIATAWADCFGNNVIEDAYIHDSRSGMNFEQNHMTSLKITRPKFRNIKSLTGTTNHLTLWGSTSSSDSHGSTSYPVRIDDPDFDTPKLNIWVPAKYSDGSVNSFKQSDVHVYRNGVDVTSSIVYFRN